MILSPPVDCMQVTVHEWYQEVSVSRVIPLPIIKLLGEMERKHVGTYEHLLRVGRLCWSIGHFIHQDPAGLRLAGLVHDIGKLNTPTELLEKCGCWTQEDCQAIQQHVMDGYQMLLPEFSFTAEIVVRHHWFQKDAYPNPLPSLPEKLDFLRQEIERLANLVALADCYDALHRTNTRNGILSGGKIREKLVEHCPQHISLIEDLYGAGIFQMRTEE